MQMDEMTQQNAALVEEASAAARAMQEQAVELTAQVGFFQLNGGAGTAPSVRESAPAVTAATEAVFAAVRAAPAPARPLHAAEPSSTAGVWKEF
jgi:methyl-accepting chemotaxis protein-1 (serine sensor receptor)